MAHLLFDVSGQKLIKKDSFFAVAKSASYLTCKFNFLTDDWDNKSVTAVFVREDDESVIKYSILDDNDECYVPNEMLENTGYVKVSIYTSDSITSVQKITTNCERFFVHESGYYVGDESIDTLTPTTYEQLINHFNEARQAVKEDKEFVEEAVEKFSHIHGGIFTSDDWTGEDTEDDPQNATIQNRHGSIIDFEGEKLRIGEIGIATEGKMFYKASDGIILEVGNKADMDILSAHVGDLTDSQGATANELNELIGNFNALKKLTNGNVANGYVGEDGCLYLTNTAGQVVVGPLGPFAGGSGGGGGGGASYSRISFTNLMPGGQTSFTITEGERAVISMEWSSVDTDSGDPTGSGTLKLFRTGYQLYTTAIAQGRLDIDVTDYIEDGDNDFRITITDSNGSSRSVIYNFTQIALNITSDFDSSVTYGGDIPFACTPFGADIAKRIVYELDGEIIYTSSEINTSGVKTSHAIPAQSHGSHKLKVWCETTVGVTTVKSPVLYYEIICVETGNANTVIATNFNVTEVVQYTPLPIEFRIYSSRSTSVDATITVKVTDEEGNETTTESQLTVGRGSTTYGIRPDTVGTLDITIRAAGTSKVIPTITVVESGIKAKATTDSQALYLSAAGRSNRERNPGSWTYGNIATSFSNVDWVSSGWLTDSEGEVGLNLINDARAVVNYKPHEVDWKGTGKTIEIEFRSHTVSDYNANIIQCTYGGRGFYVTPTKFVLQYVGGAIEAPFKENEHITVAITVEKTTTAVSCYRLVRLYINGICSAVVQYPSGANFAQTTGDAVPITIGSNDAGVMVYKFRIYDMELTRKQIVDNWIADTKSIDKMLARYTRNDIYDNHNNILISKLPSTTPYLIISTAQDLPTKKKDPAILVSGYFIWPEHPEKSFAFYDGELTVQGTSSEGYIIKNWKLKFVNGFIMFENGRTESKFKMRDNSVGINKPCLKADYASSENANNVVLVRLYNDINVYRTPHQQAEEYRADHEDEYTARDIRQGIDGFGIAMFKATDNDLRSKVRASSYDTKAVANIDANFMGKYNFNNDKGNEAVFGFEEGDESWEWLVNSGGIVNMLDGVMDDWEADTVDESGNVTKAWKTQIEARYPEDNEDYTNIKAFIDFVKSTDVVTPINNGTYLTTEQQTAIEAESDPSEKAALETQYKNSFKDTRLRKFHEQIGNWIELRAFAFNFIFKEFFLMIDSWSKNAFWTIMKAIVGENTVQSKWFDLPYDMDTAIGIDNNGNLVFSPFLEGTDHYVTIPVSALDPNKSYDIINETVVDGVSMATVVEWSSDPITGVQSRSNIFNGQDNTLYVNWQNPNNNYGYMNLSREIYRGLRSSGDLTFEKVSKMFTDHQSAWSENMYNEDGEFKYLSVLYNSGSVAHLPKLLGSKASQRLYWLYYRQLYMDSKYLAGSGADYIETRTYVPNEGLTITPYVTSYVAAEWGNNGIYVQKRTHGGEPAVLASTMGSSASGENDNVLYIYCASLVRDLGDLSRNMLGYIDVGKAYGIVRVKVGDSNPNYVNSQMQRLIFRTLESGAEYPMCRVVDARNCINLGSGINNTPKVIYLKSCTNLEEAYFDGTSIEGLDLPETGTITTLHYSSSAKAVVIKNQPNITDLVVPSWDNCDTVILENIGNAVDLKNLYTQLKSKASVRLSGFEWTANSVAEIEAWLDAIDAKQFDWLDENGISTRIAGQGYDDQERTLSCTIHIDEVTGAEVAEIRRKWIGIKIVATNMTVICTFKNGDVTLDTDEVEGGYNAIYHGVTPTKASDNKFDYTFAGWALTPDAAEPYEDALVNLTEDRTVYAVFTATLKYLTVNFYNGSVVMDGPKSIIWGGHPTYDGITPVSTSGLPFKGWTADNGATVIANDDLSTITIVTDTDFSAVFNAMIYIKFYNGSRLLQENQIEEGNGVTCNLRPTSSTGGAFLGWSSDGGATIYTSEELAQLVFNRDTNFYAQFEQTYTVRFFKYATDPAPLYTANNVPKNSTANFVGTLPTGDHGEEFVTWSPSNVGITADTDCVAVFETTYTVRYYVGNELFYTDEYIKYNQASVCPNVPQVTGKVFRNWDKDTSHVVADMNVVAVFDNTYTVTFYADTEGVNVAFIDEVESGGTAVFEGTYPTGQYNAPFVSWDQELTNITSNRYVYPIFEARYTATFYNENGSQTYQIQNGIAPNGHASYTETEPTKSGYVFSGWTYDGGTHVLTTAQLATYAITGDTSFYAQFKRLNTVTFYNGGDTYSTVNNVQSGSTVNNPSGTPVDSERGGTFLGWALGGINGTVYADVSEVTINADTNFYAKYSTAYVAYFYSDDITLWDTIKGIAPGGNATPSKGNPTRTGYKFVNWDPAPTNITNDLRSYANWEKVHTVRFMDGSTVLQTTNNVDSNTYVSFTGTTPTKSGYRFLGWDKDPATTPITADTDFVAQWIQLHTVRFMSDGTAVQTINNVDHGSYVTFTGTEPTKQDYVFDGWDKDPATTAINADTDFIAQFAEVPVVPVEWSTLCAAIDAGTVASNYQVGNELTFTDSDKRTFTAVIGGIGTDVDENGNTIPVSLIIKELQYDNAVMNDTADNTTGWSGSKMRTVTMPALKAKLPSYITERLIAAKKYSLKNDNTEEITYDELWIPSQREVGLGYETSGVTYSGLFTDNNSRIKKKVGSSSGAYWWTRTALTGNTTYFRSVSSGGDSDISGAGSADGVALGFCLGKISEEKAWNSLGNDIVNGVYTGSLAVGDTLPFTTTDNETFNAQIVGFGTDVDANGNAIPVSFIVKELQTTDAKMNDTNDNSTGWSGSKMRTTTMPALKAKLPSYIKNHLVAAKKYSLKADSTMEETVDELWIPSQREVGLTGYETSGPAYSSVFTSNTARKKFKLGASSATYYWTRTASTGSTTYFRNVNSIGNSDYFGASNAYGVALGFCWA